jgi:hypothetical protein
MFKIDNPWGRAATACLFVLIVPTTLCRGQTMRIDGAMPGGNIIVVGTDSDVVRLRTDVRDTAGWWFYWYFRVRGAAGRTLRFEFADGEPVGVRGPAVSTDAGKTWSWLGAASGNSRRFTYAFAPNAAEVRFSVTMPYVQADWQRFLRQHQADPRVRPGVLGTSRRGRAVECLYVEPRSKEVAQRALLTARHHACETMASFALEGLLEAVLKGDAKDARWLAENVEFLVVPFVDKDGVEDGDQGKNRKPRDHNRDYDGQSIYPETAALRRLVPEWSAGKLRAGLDLHCPWIRGEHNEDIYIVGSRHASIWAEQQPHIPAVNCWAIIRRPYGTDH